VHFGTKLGSSILLEHTKALVEVLSTLNEHPQVRPVRRFIKATRDVTVFHASVHPI